MNDEMRRLFQSLDSRRGLCSEEVAHGVFCERLRDHEGDCEGVYFGVKYTRTVKKEQLQNATAPSNK